MSRLARGLFALMLVAMLATLALCGVYVFTCAEAAFVAAVAAFFASLATGVAMAVVSVFVDGM